MRILYQLTSPMDRTLGPKEIVPLWRVIACSQLTGRFKKSSGGRNTIGVR